MVDSFCERYDKARYAYEDKLIQGLVGPHHSGNDYMVSANLSLAQISAKGKHTDAAFNLLGHTFKVSLFMSFNQASC